MRALRTALIGLVALWLTGAAPAELDYPQLLEAWGARAGLDRDARWALAGRIEDEALALGKPATAYRVWVELAAESEEQGADWTRIQLHLSELQLATEAGELARAAAGASWASCTTPTASSRPSSSEKAL